MNTCYIVRSSRPTGLFSFGLLDGLQVRLRRPHLREAPAGFGLERLATALRNHPGQPGAEKDRQQRSRIVQAFNVPLRVRLRFSLAAALLSVFLSSLRGALQSCR